MTFLGEKSVFFMPNAKKYVPEISRFPIKNTSYITVKSLYSHVMFYYFRLLFLSKLVLTLNKDKVFIYVLNGAQIH